MIRQWFSTHRSLVASLASGTVIAALIAGVAIVSTGYTAQRLDLGDGSVWVPNNQQQAIGRANTEVLELNTVVPTTGSDLEVLQSGSTVLLVDLTEARIEIVDPATSEVTESIALPPDNPQVYLAGDRVVIFEGGTGRTWIMDLEALISFDSQAPSTLDLGADALVSVDPAGLLFGWAPAAGMLYRVNSAVSDAVVSTATLDLGTDTAGLTLSSVAGSWVFWNSADRIVTTERGGSTDLSGLVPSGAGSFVQQAATSGSRALISHPGGLVAVPLDGGSSVELATGTSGLAAAPFALEGCEYAAWTSGQSWRRCGSDREGSITTLTAMPSTARLGFVANGTRAVLNDGRSGSTWAVQREGQLIDNWDDLIVPDDEEPFRARGL